MKTTFKICASVIILLSFASCMTVNQNLSVAPFKTSFPVSASQALFVHGHVVGQDQFKSSQEFKIKKIIKVPVLSQEGSAHLSSDLTKQMEGTAFNGMTQLQLKVKNIYSSAVSWIPVEFETGTLLGLLGGIILGEGGSQAVVPGAVVLGLGAGLVGGGFLHLYNGTIDYTLGITGVKVQY